MGGRRPFALATQREWLLARAGKTPGLTIWGLSAKLAERGIAVSPCAVWHFLKKQGITFRVKSAGKRAGSSGHGPQAGTVKEISGPD